MGGRCDGVVGVGKVGFVGRGERRTRKRRIAVDVAGGVASELVVDEIDENRVEAFLLAVGEVVIDIGVAGLNDQRPVASPDQKKGRLP